MPVFQIESSLSWNQWVGPGFQDPRCVGDTRWKRPPKVQAVGVPPQIHCLLFQKRNCEYLIFMCIENKTSCFSLLSGRTRAMNFNFPPKKGTGISRLIPSCPAPALSLLYQMLAYDPDERITAETALRHTYFREIRYIMQIRRNSQPFESNLHDKNGPVCCQDKQWKDLSLK